MAARERRNAMRSRLKEMMKAQAAAKRTGETESGVETGNSGSIEVSLCTRMCVGGLLMYVQYSSIDLWLIFAYTVTYYVCVCVAFVFVCVCVCVFVFVCV